MHIFSHFRYKNNKIQKSGIHAPSPLFKIVSQISNIKSQIIIYVYYIKYKKSKNNNKSINQSSNMNLLL